MKEEKINLDDDLEQEFAQKLDDLEFESQPQDYTMRHILIWEEDETRRNTCLEFLTDLLSGATIQAFATEAEAIEALDFDEWDTFVVDLSNEGVSSSDFLKKANNYPAAIVVALSLAFLELEERDSLKLEQIRKLFDLEVIKA